MKCDRCNHELPESAAAYIGERVVHRNPTACIGLLRAQVQDLQATTIHVADFGGQAAVDLTGRIAALEAELAALREDKARLDWLDTRLDCLDASGYGADDRWFQMLYSDGNKVEGYSVRKCIDFARKGGVCPPPTT